MTIKTIWSRVTCSSLEQEVGGSNIGRLKSDTVLSTARHRCVISLLPAGAMTQRWVPQTSYTLRRNTANIPKDLI